MSWRLSEVSIWEECPECGALGKIDRDQYMGDVSIICSLCGHHYQRERPSGWEVVLRFEGRCCACGDSLENGFLNFVNLDKYAEWEFPAWGNVLAREEDKRQGRRACSVLCDGCIELRNKRPPIKWAVEIYREGEAYKLRYHDVKLLKDSAPITKEDLEGQA
jgi:hypothetical protein